MHDLWMDVVYGLRTSFKKRLLTAAAILSLALGIGSNVAIFTLVDAFFLRPLPVEEPSRLVTIYGAFERGDGSRQPYLTVSYPDYLDYRDANQVFSGLLAYQAVGLSLASEGSEAERLQAAAVSGNYFDVLGVPTALGRTFTAEEDREPHPVVVISHSLWRKSFGADPGVVGRGVVLNRQPFTVIGVAREGFGGTNRARETQAWIPLAMYESVARPDLASLLSQRSGRLLYLIGRLAPDVELAQARTAMEAAARRLAEEYSDTNKGWGLTLLPLSEVYTQPQGRDVQLRARSLLAGAVALVLLIACINVANLLLVRAGERRREIAIRLALGAGRGKLVRQLLTESTVLALVGGLLGLLLAMVGVRFLWGLRPPFFSDNALDLSLNPRVAVFALALSLLTGIAFGLVPALRSLRVDLVTPLKDGARNSSGLGTRSQWLRYLSVTAQVALSLICLIGAGLFLRSLQSAQKIDPGFATEDMALATIDLNPENYDEELGRGISQQLLERLAAIPGVRSATLAEIRFLSGGEFRSNVFFEGELAGSEQDGLLTRTNYVAENFLETVGIPLLAGRSFSTADRVGAPPVAIVNQTMAERYWRTADAAVGQRIRLDDEQVPVTIVGVALDAKYASLREDPDSYVYLPFLQRYSPTMTFYLRTGVDPASVADDLRRAVREVDPRLPLLGLVTGEELIRRTLWAERMAAGLLSLFGIIALTLALVGIYGVIAYSVQQRRGEISLRMALGARRLDVSRMVLKEAARVVGLGLILGLVGSFFANRLIAGLLFGIEPTDLPTLTTVTGALAVAALAGSLIPALRAAAVDPVAALRAE